MLHIGGPVTFVVDELDSSISALWARYGPARANGDVGLTGSHRVEYDDDMSCS